MPFDKYTADIEYWANAVEIVADIPEWEGEEVSRTDSLEVLSGDVSQNFLVAVTSTPDGLRLPWLDVELTLRRARGGAIAIGRDQHTESIFSDQKGSLFIVHQPEIGRWTVETKARGHMPFAVNAVSYHPTKTQFITSSHTVPGIPFKCRACKTTVKGLALAIVAAATLAAMPHALILAVTKFLGVTAVAAAAFITAVIKDTADVIAEKLCKAIGLC